MKSNNQLFNTGFLTLNVFVLFAFCNLAVFYSFYNYLETLPVPAEWRGLLIGLLPVSALIFRPLISPFLTPQNAIRCIAAGLGISALCLFLYGNANSLLLLIPLRIIHGISYVILVSSSVTLLIVFMPAEKSGQGFGIVTIMTLLPYAVIPLVLEKGFPHMTQPRVYSYTAFLMLFCLLLLIPLSKETARQSGSIGDQTRETLPRGSFMANIREVRICLLLMANGLVFSAFSLVFFFLKTFSAQINVGDSGMFFTISTIVMIIIRFTMGPLFNKFDKALMIILSLGLFAAGLGLLGIVNSVEQFYGVAVLYGIGVGAATPLLNGLMYIVSKPEFRALNTNLMLEMVDAGFFLGPLAGGMAVAKGIPQTTILICCAGCALVAAILMTPFLGEKIAGK